MEEKNTYKAVSFTKGSLVSTIVGLVEAAILIAVGVTCIVCCNQEWLTKGIFLAVGIIVTLFGLAKLAMNAAPVFLARTLNEEEKVLFKGNFTTDMIMTGAIELIVGILLIVLFAVSEGGTLLESLMTFLGYTLAITLFVIAATVLVFATGFLVSKIYKVFAAVVYYVIAAILIGLGVMICIFLSSSSNFIIVVLIAAGVILCCIGLVALVTTIKDAIVAKKEKKEKEVNAPIETEAVEVKVVEIETKNEIVEK